MKYKAIVSDIDGTLTPLTLYAKPSSKIKKTIKHAQDKGIIFCLATGKPFYLVEHLIDDLHITSPVIVDNGAAIYDSQTKLPLWESLIDKKELREIFKLAKKMTLPAAELRSIKPDLQGR